MQAGTTSFPMSRSFEKHGQRGAASSEHGNPFQVPRVEERIHPGCVVNPAGWEKLRIRIIEIAGNG